MQKQYSSKILIQTIFKNKDLMIYNKSKGFPANNVGGNANRFYVSEYSYILFEQ